VTSEVPTIPVFAGWITHYHVTVSWREGNKAAMFLSLGVQKDVVIMSLM
jgi:hypothetical protein